MLSFYPLSLVTMPAGEIGEQPGQAQSTGLVHSGASRDAARGRGILPPGNRCCYGNTMDVTNLV